MRLPALSLLAALLPAPPAAADGLVVEPGLVLPGHSVAVSWRLPEGFAESELLIQVDGGPRVRLTDETREAHPRVVARIPALAGTARFLVRAGRRDTDGRHREQTVAVSEPFALGPSLAPGPLPARALSSRPSAGEPMEWWAGTSGRAPEGPSRALHGRQAQWSAEGEGAPATLPAPRPHARPSREPSGPTSLDASATSPGHAGAGFRHRAYAGAPVPLRD